MESSAHPEGVLGPYAVALRAALLQPFLRLNFVTLWVRDQERSRRFSSWKRCFSKRLWTCQLPKEPGGSCSPRRRLVGSLERQARARLGWPWLFHPKDRRSTCESAKTPDLAFLPKTCVVCSKNGRDAESASRSHQWNPPGEAGKPGTRFLKM